MILQTNGSQKKAGVAIHILDKIDFKTKKVTRDTDRHYIMTKGTIQQDDNIYQHIHIQHRSTKIYKANINRLKGRN